MQTEQIVALLLAERNGLDAAIAALSDTTKRRGRPSALSRKVAVRPKAPAVFKGRRLSAAGRKAIADAARRRWAAIKVGKAPSPFASRKKAR